MTRRSTLGGAAPVGSFAYAPTDNPLLTMLDGSQWLRGGLAVASGAFPAAASLSHLRAHRFTRSAMGANINAVSGIATDGAGTFVATSTSDAVNVQVSTDGGQTWTARAHNLGLGGIGAAGVVWTGGRFVVVGNDGTSVAAATSANGTVWALSTVAAGLAGAMTGGTTDITWNGTNVVVMVTGQNTANSIFTSSTGLAGTWTARAVPTGSQPSASSRIAGGGFCTVYTYAGGSSSQNICYSGDNGLTWTYSTTALVAGSGGGKPMVGASWAAIAGASASVMYATALGSTWVQVATSGTFLPARIMQGSGGVWSSVSLSGQLMTTTDAINWTMQTAADVDAFKPLPFASARWFCLGNASMVSADAGGSNYLFYAASTLTNANGVGGSGSVAGLWRIK